MSKESKFAKELRKMKGSWADSRKEYEHTFGGQKVPEAVYIGKIQDCKLGLTKSTSKLYIGREFLIMKGEFKGIPVRDMLHLTSDKGPVYARQFIEMMGYKCPPDDEPEALETVVAKIRKDAKSCKFRVTHSGDFTNVRVTEMIDEDDDMGKKYDLDEMSEKELKKLIKKEDLDVDPDDFDDEDELREAVEEALNEKGGDDDDEDDKKSKKGKGKKSSKDEDDEDDKKDVDLDDMDEDELREYIEDNEIDPEDLGFDTAKKLKKADEDDIREALEKYLAKKAKKGKGKKSKSKDEDEDEEEDKKSKKGKGKKKKGDEEDELLDRAKTFCGAWDIDIDDDADIDDVKEAIAHDGKDDAEYPEDELDEDEIELLKELDLEDCIKKAKKKSKK